MKKYLLFVLMLAVFLLAGFSASAQPRGSSDKVETEVIYSLDAVEPGLEFLVAIAVHIEDGWHINGHQTTKDYLVGTDFQLDYNDDFIVSVVDYPQADEFEFDFAKGDKLLVYSGTQYIYVTMRASPETQPGDYHLTGNLMVQACNNNICLAPSGTDIEIELEVVESGTRLERINSHIFSAYQEKPLAGKGHEGGPPNEIAALFDSGGAVWAFVVIFFIGLALNLTPCVYPMLSVTVSVFGAQARTRTALVLSKAVVYVLGIATMYSILGVAAAFSGRLFGFWLQNPLVLVFIGILFFLLALSMFGVYELKIPHWVSRRLGSGSYSGYIGIFFSGLVVGIFAAPCIGPPIIALITFVGTRGDPVFGFWVFFILSLGLGFPYLILGTFTGLVQKLPKSGAWMIWIKKVLGFVMIGLGLFYMGLAFYPDFTMHGIVLTMIAGGIYLGFIEGSGRHIPVFKYIKYVLGAAAIIAGIMIFINLQRESIEWQPYSARRLEDARENNQPALMYFAADWCIPCLEMDQNTFVDPRVIEITEPMARVKVDLTNFNSPESERLRQKHEITAVPTIIFLDKQGREARDARMVGFFGANDFVKRVEKNAPALLDER
ncbi:MAG: protein-disulfide reductase DsbD family protein [Desulfonatronovibrio sp.]